MICQWFDLKITVTVSPDLTKISGGAFSRFGHKIDGERFFGLCLKINSYGLVI
jgi:hypothetical protein